MSKNTVVPKIFNQVVSLKRLNYGTGTISLEYIEFLALLNIQCLKKMQKLNFSS